MLLTCRRICTQTVLTLRCGRIVQWRRQTNVSILSLSISLSSYKSVQWRSQEGQEAQALSVLQTKHKHTFELHEIG